MGGDEHKSLRAAAQVLGLGAGFVSAVFVCGGIVLVLRLTIVGLPIENVIGVLPRDFVISVGLVQVVLPSLAGAVCYAAYRLLRGDRAARPKWQRWSESDRRARVRLGLRALLLTIPLAAPGIILPIHQEVAGDGARWNLLFLLIPFCLLFLTTILCLDLLAVLSKRSTAWNGLPAVAAAAGVVLLWVAPGSISLASAFSPKVSKLCTNHGGRALAIYVGETSDELFLADLDPGDRPLVVVPQREVSQIVVGGRFTSVPCFVKPSEPGHKPTPARRPKGTG